MPHHSYHTSPNWSEGAPNTALELPILALSCPRNTLAVAERVLGRSRDHVERSYAGQARGIALRELGDVRGAVRQLRSAVTDAAAADRARLADVEASLAVTLAVAGRTKEAIDLLDLALSRVGGRAGARIRVRRGSLLGELGRPVEAAAELRRAARTLQRAGDATWESRALLNLAQAYAEVGDTRHADRALARAERLLIGTERPFEAAVARQQRGVVAILEGRIPDALAHLDQAEARLAEAGTQSAELHSIRAAALLSAGLFGDALQSAQAAVAQLERPGASPVHRAHALVRASEAALAAGHAQRARDYARVAGRLFGGRGLERARTQARLAAAKARYACGDHSRALLRDLEAIAAEAARRRMAEAAEVNLLAGELAIEIGKDEAGLRHLQQAQRARQHRSDLSKVLGWRATAHYADASGRRNQVMTACDRGLQVLDRHQLTLGATELRVAATTHGQPLAALGLRAALATGDARLIFRWAERWRATAIALPPVQSRSDATLAALLARLRLARSQLSEAAVSGRSVTAAQRRLHDLEDEVRSHALRTSNTVAAPSPRPDLESLLDELRDVRVVEIFPVDDAVHVLVASAGAVRHHVAGGYGAARHAVRLVEFALRRTSRAAPTGLRATAAMSELSGELEAQILGPAALDVGDHPVVIVPPGPLSSAPWGLLPSLHARPFSVAPSAVSWLTARRTAPTRAGVALVAGPDLRHANAEVDVVAQQYAGAAVIHSCDADTDRVLAAIDGAALAHIAAHGVFRSDNPMFSSLTMSDGPLTVFDLQRLHRAPHRLVFSCCDAGAAASRGADELLGLISALIPLGTAGMLATAAQISDEAAVPFAALVHDRLAAGDSTAEALRHVRLASVEQPALFAVAHSFNAYGAA